MDGRVMSARIVEREPFVESACAETWSRENRLEYSLLPALLCSTPNKGIKQLHLKIHQMKRLLTLASIATAALALSNCATKPAPGSACCAGGASSGKACCVTKPGDCTKPCCAKKH